MRTTPTDDELATVRAVARQVLDALPRTRFHGHDLAQACFDALAPYADVKRVLLDEGMVEPIDGTGYYLRLDGPSGVD